MRICEFEIRNVRNQMSIFFKSLRDIFFACRALSHDQTKNLDATQRFSALVVQPLLLREAALRCEARASSAQNKHLIPCEGFVK